MTMIPETDQWKLDADCGKCRRQSYCKRSCTQSERLKKQRFREMLEKAWKEQLEKQMAEENTESISEE